jgi:hypothetical protein
MFSAIASSRRSTWRNTPLLKSCGMCARRIWVGTVTCSTSWTESPSTSHSIRNGAIDRVMAKSPGLAILLPH